MAAAPEQLELDAARSQTEALYREHGAAVFRICRAVLRDFGEAEDATQQVFLSAHRALLGGAVPREPRAWLATIARRECWSRGSARRPAAELDGGLTASDASADAIRNAELAALWTAIAELPQPQRDAVLLREIRGLSYVQLAEELSLSAPATRSLLARARRRLRLQLRDLHAALGGASWIEALARLFAGGGAPGAPAARAAALGLGAAAIAGGAIATPSALEHHVRRPVAAARVARPSHVEARVVHSGVRPRVTEVVHTRAPQPTTSVPEHARRNRGHSSSPAPSESRDDHGTTTTSHEGGSGGDGGAPMAPAVGNDGSRDGGDTHGGDSSIAATTTSTTLPATIAFQTSGHDGEGGGADSGHDGGSGSGSGDGGGDGGSGSDGGH